MNIMFPTSPSLHSGCSFLITRVVLEIGPQTLTITTRYERVKPAMGILCMRSIRPSSVPS